MKKFLISLLLSVVACPILFSQPIEKKIADWAQTNPVEKVYLHLDRENYLAGQSIWFKAYFMSGLIPSGYSSTLYVELLNDQAAVVLRGIFPVRFGSAFGQLDLPDDFTTGTYLLRAYSPVMLNQPGFNFYKRIAIFGKDVSKNNKDKNSEKSRPAIRFFPEGGNLVTGILNTVAFKATDKDGMPLNIEGEIRDEKGALVTDFKSLHDGMGYFAIAPQTGKYTATIKGIGEQFPLPEQVAEGVILSVRNSPRGKQFKIVRNSDNSTFKPAYIIGQMENEVLFKQPLNGDKKEISGLIPTEGLYSGIMQLTLFNKDDMPLAERITFINNKEYILNGTFKNDTLNTDPRKRNHFSIDLKDTIIGYFSVSVTDAEYETASARPQNIYSWLLLNSDIRGYIHNSAYYFSSTADSVTNALDLVMMTNGWTRFKWTVVKQNKLPQPVYKDPGYISLSGTVYLEGRKKPLADKDIIVMRSLADTTLGRGSFPMILHTDSLGRFRKDTMIFFDRNRVLFSEVRGSKSKFISVKLDADSLNRKYVVDPVIYPYDSSVIEANTAQMAAAYTDYLRAEGKMLETVTIKVRQKSEMEKLEEQYTSGLFSGGINDRTYDLRNENYSGDIFQYLQGRIAGLSVSGTPGEYVINYRGGGLSGSNVSLFLDEVPTDAAMIESIPVNQIALIKLMPSSVATAGGGTALAIYTKKGADLNAVLESPTDIVNYTGYTISKEFYNPDYDKQPNNEKADNRLTLSWDPQIFIADVNPSIPVIFYNNDRTKRFKIVAEGITSTGKMLMIEKFIEPGAQ